MTMHDLREPESGTTLGSSGMHGRRPRWRQSEARSSRPNVPSRGSRTVAATALLALSWISCDRANPLEPSHLENVDPRAPSQLMDASSIYEEFAGAALDPAWVTWDGYALHNVEDVDNHANFTLENGVFSISAPAGHEHNQWWLDHAQIVREFPGSGQYDVRIESGFTGSQQAGLVFQSDPATFMMFMLYTSPGGELYAYIERFAFYDGQQYKMTVAGRSLGLPVPDTGPYHLRVVLSDHANPAQRSWTFSWSRDGATWEELFSNTFEGPQGWANIGAIEEVGLFAGNQPFGFSAFDVAFDYFRFDPSPPEPIPSVTDLAARGGDQLVELWWESAEGADSYSVYDINAGGSSLIGTTTNNWYVVDGLVNGTEYEYYVVATFDDADGDPSASITAVPHVPTAFNGLPQNGLLLALSASELTHVYADGESVTHWPNVVGPLTAAFAGLDNAPALVAAGINGHPAVRFDGDDDYLSLPSGFQDFTAGLTYVVVKRPSQLQSGFKILALGNGANQENIVLGRAGVTPGYQFFTNNGSGQVQWFDTGTGFVAGEASVSTVILQPGSANATTLAEVSKNGSPVGSGNVFVPPVTDRTLNFIGQSYWSDGLFEGDIAEILLYNRSLSSSELQAVHQYVGQKYGVSMAGGSQGLAAPGSLDVAPSAGMVALNWSAVPGAVGYRVYRSDSLADDYVEIADVAGTAVEDTDVVNGQTYYYVVAAYNGEEQSENSVVAAATPLAPAEPSLDPRLPIDGLQVALDAAFVTPGHPVTLWPDASPADNDATVIAGSATASVVAAGINGRPAVRFDGVDDYLNLPSGFHDFTDGLSMYVVLRPSALQPGMKILALGNGPGQENVVLGRAGTTSGFQYFTSNSAGSVSWFDTPGGLAPGQATVVSLIQQPGSPNSVVPAELATNGLVTGGAGVYVPPVQARSTNYIGRSYWNDGYFQGDVAEVLVYSRTLSVAEQHTVADYLAGKYGIAVATPPPLSTPTELSAVPGNAAVLVTWNAVAGATGYRLYRATGAVGPYEEIADVSGTQYTDEQVSNGQIYRYAVQAYSGSQESPLSAEVSATPSSPVPPALDPGVPTDGLVLALDAASAATLVGSGQPVILWPDASPAGNDGSVNVGAAAPTLVINAINGRPAIRFDGVDDYLDLPDGFEDFTEGVTYFAVVRPTVLQSGFKLLALGNGANQQNIVLGRAGATAGYQYFTDSSSGAVGWFNTASGLVAGETSVVSVVQQAGSPNGTVGAQVFKNGSVLGGANVYAPPIVNRTVNYIARSYWTDGRFQGDIAEILLFNRTLSAGEQQAIMEYLQQKYGIDP